VWVFVLVFSDSVFVPVSDGDPDPVGEPVSDPPLVCVLVWEWWAGSRLDIGEVAVSELEFGPVGEDSEPVVVDDSALTGPRLEKGDVDADSVTVTVTPPPVTVAVCVTVMIDVLIDTHGAVTVIVGQLSWAPRSSRFWARAGCRRSNNAGATAET